MNKSIFTFLRVFVSAALIVILLYIMRGNYNQIGKVLKGTNLFIFTFAFALFIGAVALATLRLKLICEAQEIPIKYPEALSLTFIGYFFNNFLPTTIGGDVVKAYYMSKKTVGKMTSFTSVFVDRAIGLFTMIFMAFAALLFAGKDAVSPTVRYAIYAITLASLLFILVIANKRLAKSFSKILSAFKSLKEPLKKAYSMINNYKNHQALMLNSLWISVISQLFFFLSLAFLAVSIGFNIPFGEILLKLPIVGMISLLPSINGLGLREGSTVLLFGPLIGRENAFAVSILWLLLLFITSIIGGVIYGTSPQFKVKFK